MEHIYTYINLPFNHSSGYKYAMVIVKLAVARLVHSYRFTTPLKLKDIRYSVDINIHFLMKHLVEVERRWYNFVNIELIDKTLLTNTTLKISNKVVTFNRRSITCVAA